MESLDHRVSTQEISTFRQDGVVCLRSVIPEEWISRLQAALEEHMSSVGAGEAFNQMNVCDHHPTFRDFVTRSPLPEIAAQLMQSSEVHFYFDHLFVKEPGSDSPTPWHRDYPHWDISGENLCSVWVPLDPATIESGVVEYVRGSHRTGAIWGKEADFTDADKFPDVSADRARDNVVHFDVNPGDCIIHDPRVTHGAPANKSSDIRRRAIAVRYAGDNTKDRELAVTSAARSYGYNSRIAGAGYPRVWPPVDS